MERGPRFGAIRTARMEAEIIDGWRETPQCQVAFGECAGDRKPLLPETSGIARCARGRVTVGIALSEWHPAQFAQDIFAVTAGKACDENAAITLADRKTGRAIGMRGAQTHGGAAMPGTAESTYEIDEFLRSEERRVGKRWGST